MKKTLLVPFALVGAVALALSACDPKSNSAADAAREKQLQDMQAKIDALSTQSAALNQQIADRDASDLASKRDQLDKEQADVENQRAKLEADRSALADATPVARYVPDEPIARGTSDSSNEPIYQGKSETYDEPVYQGKPATYDVFYSKLDDDGDWVDSDQYGYIWRPNVARNSSWRPYTDGRWVDTDRGWTWDSNERFGWATYHYGRWVNLNHSGWCWVPGNEWAPAWVSWRTSDRYVGWAPLPPEARIERGGSITAAIDISFGTGPAFFSFVDNSDFGDETYVGRVVPAEQNITIINQTTNVTNITYVNRVVNNYGPDYDQIARKSRKPVNRYQLDLARGAQFDRNAARPRANGNRLTVVAPVINVNQKVNQTIRPAKVGQKIVQADREKGWKGLNPAQRKTAQENLARQADRQAQIRQAQQEQQKARNVKAGNPAPVPVVNPATTPALVETVPTAPTPAPVVADTTPTQPPPNPAAQNKRPNSGQPLTPEQQKARNAQNGKPNHKPNGQPNAQPNRPQKQTPVIPPPVTETPVVATLPENTPQATPDAPAAQAQEAVRKQRQNDAAQQAQREQQAQAARQQAAKQQREQQAQEARQQAVQQQREQQAQDARQQAARRQQAEAQAVRQSAANQADRENARRQQAEAQQARQSAAERSARQAQENQPRREVQQQRQPREDAPRDQKRSKPTPTPDDGNPRASRPQ